jgi:sugar lactone lactonase YvrE
VAVDLDGRSEVMARVPAFRFSIDWLPDGRLLVVAGSDRLLLRGDPDASLETYVDLTSLWDRPWNEIVVDGRGSVYLNSIGFDMMTGEEVAPGILALVTPDSAALPMVAPLGDGTTPESMPC